MDALTRYQTARPTLQHLLSLLQKLVGLRTTYSSQVVETTQTVLDVCDVGGCALQPGAGPLAAGPCSLTVRAGQFVLIEDARQDPRTRTLPATDLLGIGSYIGVPVYLDDGSLFGTFCAIDPEPWRFEAQTVEGAVVLARLLGQHLSGSLSAQVLLERAKEVLAGSPHLSEDLGTA